MLRRLSSATFGSLDKLLGDRVPTSASSSSHSHSVEVLQAHIRHHSHTCQVLCASSDNDNDDENDGQSGNRASIPDKLTRSKGRWHVNVSFDTDDDADSHVEWMDRDDETGETSESDLVLSELTEDEDEEGLVHVSADTRYVDGLRRARENPKIRRLVLWGPDDFDLLPLRIDEIQYWNDLYWEMKQREEDLSPCRHQQIFARHPDLSVFMRAKLFNWLFEVVLHLRLQRKTLYLTQHFIDSHLMQSRDMHREEFQLLGLASILIAAKLEEVRPPGLAELAQICDESFTVRQIAAYELRVCSALRWRLAFPTVLCWVEMYMAHLAMFVTRDELTAMHTRTLALTDVLLHSPRSLGLCPSVLASAALLCNYPTHYPPRVFSICTGGTPLDVIEAELTWIQSYMKCPAAVAFFDPSLILNDSTFHALLEANNRALTFIHKQIKIEEADAAGNW